MNIAVLSGQESGSSSQDDDQSIWPKFNATDPVGPQKTQIQPLTVGTFREEKCQSMHGACGSYSMECLGKSGRLP